MNHLATETSPYLRQHRDNPVDWYPWGEAAFAAARQLDRPIFVSIGYSACHWCHVMAHESFEDEEIAAYVNEYLIAVKVDREERPDVDAIYMDAVVSLTGGGGWPLTIFTTAEGRPFYGGTYFPKRRRGNLPSFLDLCQAVVEAWSSRRTELVQQADDLTQVLAVRLGPLPPAARPASAPLLLEEALGRLDAVFDRQYGGIGGAPKFPQVPIFELALVASVRGRRAALEMVSTTLSAMARGGIYDHLGGGFARYSVDQAWQVPHFEKMLYDQAGIARLLLHCWQLTGDDDFAAVLEETITYVLRDLRLPDGGIASSEDADSDGGEGRFYTWTLQEITAVLGPTDGAAAIEYYGVTSGGNFEDGRSILHRPLAGELRRSEEMEELRSRLFAARTARPRPGLDDKVLTEWNAMFCAALAEAALVTGNDEWADAAVEIGDFLCSALRRPDGRWLRSYQGGRAEHLAVASDYAWLVDAFTRLSELTGRGRWVEEALRTAGGLIDLFVTDEGGVGLTGSDAPPLIVRPRDTYDGVLPAAGSIAALALGRLGALLGEEELAERAHGAVAAAGEALVRSPMAFPTLVIAGLLLEEGALEIVIAGERPDLVATAAARYEPAAVLCWGERTDSPLWEGRSDGHAYVCRGGTCLAPVATSEELTEAIERSVAVRR